MKCRSPRSLFASLAAALPLVLLAGHACAQWSSPFGPQARIDYVTGNVYVGTTGFSNPLVRFDVVDQADTSRVISFHAFSGTPLSGVRTTAIWGETNNPQGRALQGFNFATTGTGAGIWAENASATGTGLRARATSPTGASFAAHFDNASIDGVGVYSTVTSPTGASIAAHFDAISPDGVGVYATVTDNTATETPIAIWGNSVNATGYAGYFSGGRNYFEGKVGIGTANPAHPLSIAAADDVTLLQADNASTGTNACGFTGAITSASPGLLSAGIRGTNAGTTASGVGVFGSHAGQGYGVYGVAIDPLGYAAYFNRAVSVNGNLSKTGGTFKIDHPLDPANKYLYHSFVESPDMMNIYNGNATTDADGYATIIMPDYFNALNTGFRYQLTVIDEEDNDDMFIWAKVVRRMTDKNAFTIRTSRGNVDVSWQVTGVRQDAWANAHRVVPEVEKEPYNKGKYLHPELFGASPDALVSYLHGGSNTPASAPSTKPVRTRANTPPRSAPLSNEPPLTPAIQR